MRLTDGVYAFAMTLLVVNIELPDGFDPKSNQGTSLGARAALRYVHRLCHHVSGPRQLSGSVARGPSDGPETASAAYAWASILHLFPVTFMPFAMLVAGRFDFPAAIWVYGANMIVLALSVIAISLIGEDRTGRARLPHGSIELGILIASALLSMAIGWVTPGYAMLAYLLNLATPFVSPAIYSRRYRGTVRTGAARIQRTRATSASQLRGDRFQRIPSAPSRSSSESAKRSGKGRLASWDGGLRDSPL